MTNPIIIARIFRLQLLTGLCQGEIYRHWRMQIAGL